MSPEFVQEAFMHPAKAIPAEDVNEKNIGKLDEHLEGRLMVYKSIKDEIIARALSVADGIDDREETNVPFRRNAVHAASLLATACIRGAQMA